MTPPTHEVVKARYGAIASGTQQSCCGESNCCDTQLYNV